MRQLILVSLLWLACWALPVYADDDLCPTIVTNDQVLNQLNDLEENGCFGGKPDSAPWVKAILEKLPQTPAEQELKLPERVNRFKEAAELLDQQLIIDANQPYLIGFDVNPFVLIKRELDNGVNDLANDLPPIMFKQVDWKYQPESGKVGSQFSLQTDFLANRCAIQNGTDLQTRCADATTISMQTLRYLKLLTRIKHLLNGLNLTNFHKNIARFDNQWRLYATEARSQTPIELALNSWYFSRRQDHQGFVGAPDYQIIFLHPSVVMEQVSKADSGSKLKAGIAMEWLGGNWWSWSDDDGGSMKMPFGISIISTYSDRAGTKDLGHGLMLHYDHVYSLGVTRHGDDTGIFLSVDLQKLFTDKASKLAEVKQKFNID